MTKLLVTNNTPKIAIETITPQVAATLLGTMTTNRPLRKRAVNQYARDMIAGRWLLNGEAIKVDRSGRLIDGQHRLSAVMAAKASVSMLVVRGVDESAMITLDTGVARSFNDVATIAGKSYARSLGPIARWWFKYQSGSPTVNYSPTHQEIDAILVAHPVIEDSAGFIYRHKTLRMDCVASVQGFVHAYAAERYDREMADTFMQDLNDGASLGKTDPIYLLRKRLVEDHRATLESSHVLALTIKAWNAWLAGEKIANLRWVTGGQAPEDFPRFSIDLAKPKAYRTRARQTA